MEYLYLHIHQLSRAAVLGMCCVRGEQLCQDMCSMRGPRKTPVLSEVLSSLVLLRFFAERERP